MAKKKITSKLKKVTKTIISPTVSKKSDNKIIPLHDRVLVRPLNEKELALNLQSGEEKKTNFGIILPDTLDEENVKDQGVVVAVGEGKYDDGKLNPMTVKVGDRVMFSKYGFDEITVGEEDYFILKEENILAIIK